MQVAFRGFHCITIKQLCCRLGTQVTSPRSASIAMHNTTAAVASAVMSDVIITILLLRR